jgi:hypothetical protein
VRAGSHAISCYHHDPEASPGTGLWYRIPAEALSLLDLAVEIPMVGTGASLNVAVAGSLVLYRLAGFL